VALDAVRRWHGRSGAGDSDNCGASCTGGAEQRPGAVAPSSSARGGPRDRLYEAVLAGRGHPGKGMTGAILGGSSPRWVQAARGLSLLTILLSISAWAPLLRGCLLAGRRLAAPVCYSCSLGWESWPPVRGQGPRLPEGHFDLNPRPGGEGGVTPPLFFIEDPNPGADIPRPLYPPGRRSWNKPTEPSVAVRGNR
jgi:hypothetical protein